MKNYRRYKGNRPKSGARKWLTALLVLILLGVVCFGALFGLVLGGSRDDVQGDPQIMVILGCQVKPWGPSILLQDRLNTALDYLADHPDVTVVVSGAQGPDEPSTEAFAMAEYLMANGVPEENIILEEQSHNTWQNLVCSLVLLEELGYDTDADMVVVSNGFHLTRVRMLWSRIHGGDDNLSTLAAPSSHVPSRLRMYISFSSLLFHMGIFTATVPSGAIR